MRIHTQIQTLIHNPPLRVPIIGSWSKRCLELLSPLNKISLQCYLMRTRLSTII